MTSKDFSFGKFAQNAFYGKINARLVDMADVTPGQRIVDLACGTGGVTQLILERLRGARDSVVIAVDNSATAASRPKLSAGSRTSMVGTSIGRAPSRESSADKSCV